LRLRSGEGASVDVAVSAGASPSLGDGVADASNEGAAALAPLNQRRNRLDVVFSSLNPSSLRRRH
jgi:hypothetical protein